MAVVFSRLRGEFVLEMRLPPDPHVSAHSLFSVVSLLYLFFFLRLFLKSLLLKPNVHRNCWGTCENANSDSGGLVVAEALHLQRPPDTDAAGPRTIL